jgi:hypothetical protein
MERFPLTEVTDQLKHAVESEHGGTATFVQSGPVHEQHRGQTVWTGTVAVFNLGGSPTGAFRAYAWPCEPPNRKRRFLTVLHTPVIVGPLQAVRAAIAMEATEATK